MHKASVNCQTSWNNGWIFSKFEEIYKLTDLRNTTNAKENKTEDSHTKEYYWLHFSNQITEKTVKKRKI